MVRFKAGQQAVKGASVATVASLGSFGSDVTDASRMLARDAPAVARRVQQDLGSAALHVHHSVRDAIVTAGTGLYHATQQVGFVVRFLRQCMLQNCQSGNLQYCAECWCQQVCFMSCKTCQAFFPAALRLRPIMKWHFVMPPNAVVLQFKL